MPPSSQPPHTHATPAQGAGQSQHKPAIDPGTRGLPSPPPLSIFQALSTSALIDRYRVGVENFDRRVLELTDEQLDTAFLSTAGCGRWPARVLVGHLADAELAFVHRLRRAVAEDRPVLAVWDEAAFIDRCVYGTSDPGARAAATPDRPAYPPQPLAGFIATVHTLRRWTGEWLAGLTQADFERAALHPERGPQSVRSILEYATWHVEHHGWYLQRKLERLGADPR